MVLRLSIASLIALQAALALAGTVGQSASRADTDESVGQSAHGVAAANQSLGRPATRAPAANQSVGQSVGPRSPGNDPPNSFDPGAKGKVKLSHEHRRALSCSAKREKNETVCTAERGDADSATSLLLHPIRASRIAAKDKRQDVAINFASQRRRQERTLELGFGEWEVEWSGLDARPRFRVESTEEFEVELRTLTGKCKKSNDECVLEPSATSKECNFPSGRRAAAD